MIRRHLLIGLGLSPMAAVFLGRAAGGAEETSEETVEYLFVQDAERASLAEGVLTLQAVSPNTLFFSDRPERIAGTVPTQKFVAHWATGTDSFKADPPNATLSVLKGDEPQLIVVELKNPRLEANNLIYDAGVLDGKQSVDGGPCSLFIDIIGRPLTPLSFAGVRRRTYRRVLWR